MGIGTWGFAKGASKTLLDNIATRQEFDMQLEKEKKLAELRAEQQKDLYIFQKDINRKERDDKLTEIDYTSGFVIYRNGNNEEIGRRKLNQAELDAHAFDTEKNRLDIEGKKLTMASTRQRMALDQQENARAAAQHRKYMSGQGRGSGDSDGSPSFDTSTPIGMSALKDKMANELLYRYKDGIPESYEGNPTNLAREVVEVWTRNAPEFKKKGITLDDIWRRSFTAPDFSETTDSRGRRRGRL